MITSHPKRATIAPSILFISTSLGRSGRAKVELQLRTRLQHAWATANEIVGTFRREELKSGEGGPDWLRYFVLAVPPAYSRIAAQDATSRRTTHAFEQTLTRCPIGSTRSIRSRHIALAQMS